MYIHIHIHLFVMVYLIKNITNKIEHTNLINTTNMHNSFMNFKKYLLSLSPNEQICKTNKDRNCLTKSNRKKNQ